MAAPTSVRVEATSIDTTVIRWTYSGSAGVSIYRSTDGISYSSIVDGLATTTTEYTDTGLATGTKYWYKLTDDAGATFSSIVTVYTHFCTQVLRGSEEMRLPRLVEGGDPVEEFNELATRVEQVLGDRLLAEDPCVVCPTDGAIVLNCSNGCKNWVVVVDEDINSVTMDFCEQGPGSIEFIIPPNVTRSICGFPGGFGFTGDECTQAPISGGTTGRSVSVGTSNGNRAVAKSSGSRPGYNAGGGRSSGGSGGATCVCVPNGNGALTIKSCNANNSMNCAGTKSLLLIACGGRPPYTWSRTGSVTLQGGTGQAIGTSATGAQVTVRPPANTGSAVAGTAYRECHYGNNGASGCNTTNVIFNDALDYGCDDVLDACQAIDSTGCSVPSAQLLPCITTLTTCSIPVCTNCTTHNDYKQPAVDRRSAPMIAAGCNPCGVSTIGATVSVTDSIGTVTTIALRN